MFLSKITFPLALAGIALCACSSSSGASSPTTDGGGGSDGAGGGAPTITISSPAANASVAVTGSMKEVAITFAVTNFKLTGPTTCGSLASTDNCGHIHVLVDGAACTPDGAPYDNDATSSPAQAILSTCPMADGTHTAVLELHHDDHSPVIGSNGMVISASITFTSTG